MNPRLQQFSESDCEIAYQSDSFEVEIQNLEIEQNSSQLKLTNGYDQFEQQSILNNCLNTTQCSSSNVRVVETQNTESEDDLKCSEVDSQANLQQVAFKCQCSKSQCQQSYCECFARGKTCGKECGCLNCENKEISKKLKKIQKRLKKQQREKQRTPRFLKGCTCGKSKCVNKFCSCHLDGKYCTKECKCVDCKNVFKFSIRRLENLDQVIEEQKQQYQFLFQMGFENSEHFKQLNEYLQNI